MDVEALKEEIELTEERIRIDKIYVKKVKLDIAYHLCPFVVGEIILKVEGNEKVMVDSIDYNEWGDSGYSFRIRRYRKDGEPYKYATDTWGSDVFKKLHEPSEIVIES